MQTLTEEQAFARLEEHLRQAIAQVQPAAGAEPGMRITVPCDDPSDGGPPGRVFVEAHYWLHGVPPERNRAVLDALYDYWAAHGYHVLSDQRTLEQAPQLKVVHREDSFVVILRQNLADQLEILGSSPCVWPEGTPSPEAEAEGKAQRDGAKPATNGSQPPTTGPTGSH
jgi:hypothetical protein